MPKFIINPLLVPTIWAGPDCGFRAFKNRSWLNSVWLGTVWNVACLPERIWDGIFKPLARGQLLIALGAVFLLVFVTLTLFAAGLAGHLVMLPFDNDVLSDALVLELDEAQADVASGNTAGIRVRS